MDDLKQRTRNIKNVFLVSVTTVAVLLLLVSCRFPIVAFCVRVLAPVQISSVKSFGNPLGVSKFRGMGLKIDGTDISLLAEEATVNFKSRRFFSAGGVEVHVGLKGVTVDYVPGNTDEGGPSPMGKVLSLPLSPGVKYKRVMFSFVSDKDILRVSDLFAISDDIKISGNYLSMKNKDEVELDFKISFSPDMVKALPDTIKDNLLDKDEKGWSGTVINYKGNSVLLKALYSLSLG